MIIKIIPYLVLSLSLSFILTPRPLILGIWVFILALISSIIVSIISSWVAIIIFLIYIGGLLVLFAYFLAIQPNQFTGVTSILWFTTLGLSFFYLTPHITTSWSIFTNSSPSIPFIIFTPNMPIIILLAALLLLILVIVVKITDAKSGPLRSFT